jgi:drug/metabolite transporter (DMT)-like permease
MSSDTPPSLRRRAVWALLAAVAFWGLSFPAVRALTMVHERLEPGAEGWFWTASAIWPRFAIAAALLALWRRRESLPTGNEARQGLGLAAFLGGGLALQVDGLRFTEASTSAFLTQLFVILVPAFAYGRKRRMPPARIWLGAVLVVAGVAILADADWRRFSVGRGELETLLSAAFFAGQILWLERPVFRGNRPAAVTQAMFVAMAAGFLAAGWALAPRAGALAAPFASAPWVAFTAVLAVGCTLVAFVLMNTWQPKLEASEAGIIYSVEPLVASILALVLPGWFSVLGGIDYPGETIGARLLLGGALITAATVLVQLTAGRSASCEPPRRD